jgi:hypothetical protein
VILELRKILAGVSASTCLFAIVNYANFRKPATCADCYFERGLPFAFFQEGGFAGDSGYIGRGVAADSLVVLKIGVAAAYIIPWLIRKLLQSDLPSDTK